MHHLKIPALGYWAQRAFSAVNLSRPLQLSSYQRRFKATRVDCQHLEPKCGDRFKQRPCIAEQVDIKQKQQTATDLPVQERSIRLKHLYECCGSSCPDALPRFDLLYYKRTNKFEGDYQQTWNECPELVKKPKAVCCLEKIKPAKLKKRPRQQRPQTACHQSCATTQAKCPYTTLKGCRVARHPPKCKPIAVRKVNCKKRKVAIPAFSECNKKLPKARPVECRCLLAPSICEVWAHHNYMRSIKKIRSC